MNSLSHVKLVACPIVVMLSTDDVEKAGIIIIIITILNAL